MKVKLTRIMAGPGGVFAAGSTIDVDDEQASALIAGRYAEALEAARVVVSAPAETATAPRAPERAVRPPARKR